MLGFEEETVSDIYLRGYDVDREVMQCECQVLSGRASGGHDPLDSSIQRKKGTVCNLS